MSIAAPIDDAVDTILQQLEIKVGTQEEAQAIEDNVRQELHNLFPDGNWHNVRTRADILKEVERVKKLKADQRANDPGASLRASIKKAMPK